MRYIAVWFLVFALAGLGALLVAALVFATQYVVEKDLWWAPAGVFIAALLATLATALEYLSDTRGETPE